MLQDSTSYSSDAFAISGAPRYAQRRRPQRRAHQTNEKFSDACNLRLLGLRATIEVLKQPPVIAKQERAGEGD